MKLLRFDENNIDLIFQFLLVLQSSSMMKESVELIQYSTRMSQFITFNFRTLLDDDEF